MHMLACNAVASPESIRVHWAMLSERSCQSCLRIDAGDEEEDWVIETVHPLVLQAKDIAYGKVLEYPSRGGKTHYTIILSPTSDGVDLYHAFTGGERDGMVAIYVGEDLFDIGVFTARGYVLAITGIESKVAVEDFLRRTGLAETVAWPKQVPAATASIPL